MRLLKYIIVFGFGAVFGYLIHIPPTFESIVKFIGAGLSVGFIGLIYRIYKDKKERQLKHSNLLVDTYLKLHAYSRIEFKDKFSLCIKKNLSNIPEEENYSKYFDAHLKSGYLEPAWKRKEDYDNCFNKYNISAQQFDTKIDKLINDIKGANPSFKVYESGTPPVKFFKKYLSSEIREVLKSSYEKMVDIDDFFRLIPDNNQWKITSNNGELIVVSDNKIELEKILAQIKKGLNDALKSEDFSALKKYHKDTNNKDKLFTDEINRIIRGVKNDSPLEGRCEECKSLIIF